MELNEAINFSKIFSTIKGIPDSLINYFKSKPEHLEPIEKYLFLMQQNPEHTYVPPEAKESKRIFDDFIKGMNISDEDKKKFIENFKKYAKISRNVLFGFALGVSPLFSLLMTFFELFYIHHIMMQDIQFKGTVDDAKKEILENFIKNHPKLWALIEKYKAWKERKNTKWSYTDDESSDIIVDPIIVKSNLESIHIISYNEYKENILNENILMAMSMGIPTLIGFGAGVLVKIYIDSLKHKKRLEEIYDKAKKEGKSKEELKKLKDQLDVMTWKNSYAIKKINKKKEEIKKKEFKLSDLPKEKQEAANKKADKYTRDLIMLNKKEKDILNNSYI